eukprot:CAMPEP_0194750804 /NCGR_PEP_ID=MMETSP0323_2-20130528/4910_1 /TAXON_ID=2866 ORGANISM="Crypthecodinium cohnii, Strain Seligo" /NCGR_SAMPLE_ID=MMETSP0323_2 /ASSEMBLY_ACC=CAM_ASM_000346 /LENGTH=56 /DNA_ID=CAMNT_0039666879 /DNA_START=85 /DNA_END=255 /DNA_ORIENTATION=-
MRSGLPKRTKRSYESENKGQNEGETTLLQRRTLGQTKEEEERGMGNRFEETMGLGL